MTIDPIYRPIARHERKRQAAYADQAASAEMYLTGRYGPNWWDSLSTEAGVPTITPPQLTEDQKSALLEAAKQRVATMENDGGFLDDAYDVVKGVSRAVMSVSDAAVDVSRNQAVDSLIRLKEIIESPTVEEALGFFSPQRVADSAYNTTLWTQVSAVVDSGGDSEAGFGQEATGDGFFVSPESAIGQEKDKRALDFATLSNGEAASLGRFLAGEVLRLDKDSTEYKTISGLTDAVAILAFDPLNFMGTGAVKGAAKSSKLLTSLQRMGFSTEELEEAAVAASRFGRSLDTPDVQEAMHSLLETRNRLQVLKNNPDLKTVRRQWDIEQADRARREAAFVVRNKGSIESARDLASDADDAIRSTNAALDEGVQAHLDAEDAVRRWERWKPAEDDLGTGRVGNAVDPDEGLAESAARVHEAYAREQEAVAAFASAQDELLATMRTAGADLGALDAEDVLSLNRALSGVLTGEGADLSAALRAFRGGNFDEVARVAADTESAAVLRDLLPGIDAETIRQLANINDPHQALIVMMNSAVNGQLGNAPSMIQRHLRGYGYAGAKGSTFVRRVDRFLTSNKPSVSLASFHDAESMVRLADDFITEAASLTYRKGQNLPEWELFRNDYISQMLMAATPEARKRVWVETQQELVKMFPGYRVLNDAAKEQVAAQLGWVYKHQYDTETRGALLRTMLSDPQNRSALFGTLDEIKDQHLDTLITSLTDLSLNVAVIDPKAVQRLNYLLDEAGRISAKGQAVQFGKLVNDAFDGYLRPLFLAFRPAYTILQVADSGARGLLMGHTNLLTSPLQTMAIAAHVLNRPNSRFAAALRKIVDNTPTAADGTPMFGSAQMDALTGVLREMDESEISRHLARSNFRDFFLRDRVDGSVNLGWRAYAPGEEGYMRAWADDAMNHLVRGADSEDTIFQSVFDLALTGKVPDHIDDWARANGVQATAQETITEWFFSGPGRAEFERLIASAQRNPNDIPLLETIANDRTKLHSYLFDPDEAASVHNLVDQLTGRSNPAVMQLLDEARKAKDVWLHYVSTLDGRKLRRAKGGKVTFIRDIHLPNGQVAQVDMGKRGAFNQFLQGQLKALVPDDQRPLSVRRRESTGGADHGFADTWNDMLESFFQAAGRTEKRYGQSPILRDSVLLESAKRASLLSPDDAAILQERILAQIPKYKRTAVQREAIAWLKAGVRDADGDGHYTLEMLKEGAERDAMRELAKTMYGVKGRNAAAARFAILFPFIQSWANASRVYLKESVRNPKRAVNAMRLLRTSQTEESGVVYDLLPGVNRDDDPSKPLMWLDEFGNRKVSIPLLGYVAMAADSALATISGTPANPNGLPYMDVAVSRWNPMNFGEPLPGVGPGVTVPASIIDNSVATLPEDLRKWVFAMEGTDSSLKAGFVEQNMPWFAKLVMPSEDMVRAQVGNAMVALTSNYPEKYLDSTGTIKQEQMATLIRDAEALAKGLAKGNIWRAALFRGGTTVQRTIKADNGDVIPLAVLSAEFDQILEDTGTTQDAYMYLVDKYGPQALAVMVGGREYAGAATDEGYQFAVNNMDTFKATADVLAYFFPATDENGDLSPGIRSLNYQRLLTEYGKGRLKSPEDWASDYNRRLKSVRDEVLDHKFAMGQLTESQYKAEKALLAEDYGLSVQEGYNTSFWEQTQAQIREALTHPEVLTTPAGEATAQYMAVYDAIYASKDGESLDGKADAPLREYLRATGERLAQEYPEFLPMWRSKLMWEVSE